MCLDCDVQARKRTEVDEAGPTRDGGDKAGAKIHIIGRKLNLGGVSPACGAQLNWDTFQFRPKFRWKPLVRLKELLYVAFPLRLTIHNTIQYDYWRGRPTSTTKCLTTAMALQQTLVQYICSVLLLVSAASALKFDLIAQAESSKRERCVRNFVGKDTLVVVTATVDGYKGDGMVVNLYVRCAQMHTSYKAKLT